DADKGSSLRRSLEQAFVGQRFLIRSFYAFDQKIDTLSQVAAHWLYSFRRVRNIVCEKREKRRHHRVGPFSHRLDNRNQHSTGRNDLRFDLAREFGMALEERTIEAKTERVARARLLAAIFISGGFCRRTKCFRFCGRHMVASPEC